MERRWWLVVIVVALIAQCWALLSAPQAMPYVAGALAAFLLVSFVTNVVLSRRRRIPVSHALRPDAAELTALQDDFLGRLPSQDTAPIDAGPVAAQVEPHGDPQGDLLPDAEPGPVTPAEGR